MDVVERVSEFESRLGPANHGECSTKCSASERRSDGNSICTRWKVRHSATCLFLLLIYPLRTMYSGGGDCVARVWDVSSGGAAIKDAEKDALNEADEAVTSITTTPMAWITSSADSAVRLYNSNSNQLQSVILEGGGVAVRHVAVDPAFERLAVASE